jgi:predicted cobalt transporter CbtA
MIGALLLRGMLVGVLAGLLSFGFLKLAGEPSVDRAIAIETQVDKAKAAAEHKPYEEEPEIVSREVQAGTGLFTGVMVYSTAFGGLFALAFALAYGRIGALSPRAVAVVLAALGFIAVHLIPALKYPPNPPSVGDPDTIGMRTALYFSLIAVSIIAMIAAGMLRSRLQPRFGAWNSGIIAGAAYLVLVIVVGLTLPQINEVPAQFPAVLLWQFRITSLAAQLILWTTLGLAFGALAERAAENAIRRPQRAGLAARQ